VIVGRFIPGGRTAVTFSCGFTHAMRWRRFIVADVIAGVLWASYAALLGYWGGKRFEDQPWKGLLIAFAIAVAASGGTDPARRLRARGAAPGVAGAGSPPARACSSPAVRAVVGTRHGERNHGVQAGAGRADREATGAPDPELGLHDPPAGARTDGEGA